MTKKVREIRRRVGGRSARVHESVLKSVFELLREKGSYAGIRSTILERDIKLSGDLNPMLAQHGQASEARQYSGMAAGAEWQCPFHARHAQKEVHR